MPNLKNRDGNELYDDGTRRKDNVFLQIIDRANGTASRRRDEAEQLQRDLADATFGRGPLAGKTGDPFKDDPFFNPWAPGGAFNKFGC